MDIAEFTQEESRVFIWWLLYLLGGTVTIPDDDQFWDDNFPNNAEVYLDHDDKGNPVLIAGYAK